MNSTPTFEERQRWDEEWLRMRQSREVQQVSSGFTEETLREAIADAKAVRAQALANARAALEEAFSKRFEEVFAEKFKQENDRDEITLDELIAALEAKPE